MALQESLRERKKAQTRADLISAALDLFTERGYEETTIDDIVDRANYSRTTFFRCFGTKEDVLFDEVPAHMTLPAGRLSREPDADPVAELRRVLTDGALEYAGVSERHMRAIEFWFSEPALRRRHMDITSELERVAAEYLAEMWGVDADESVEAWTVAGAMLAVLQASTRMTLASRDVDAIRAVLDRGFALVEHGTAMYATSAVAA